MTRHQRNAPFSRQTHSRASVRKNRNAVRASSPGLAHQRLPWVQSPLKWPAANLARNAPRQLGRQLLLRRASLEALIQANTAFLLAPSNLRARLFQDSEKPDFPAQKEIPPTLWCQAPRARRLENANRRFCSSVPNSDLGSGTAKLQSSGRDVPSPWPNVA